MTSSVEQHDHGGGFDGELDVSTKKQVHARRNPRRESRNVRASTATAALRRRKLSTTRRRAPRRGTPEARQITRRRRTRRRSSGNRCQRNSSKRSITRCSGCPPRRTTRIGSSTRSASASLWSFPPRTTVAPPQSHHQSAWLRPRPPSQKRVRGTRKRAKRVSARRWMFRLVRSDVAGTSGKNWRCSEMAMPGHKHCQKHMRWSAGGTSSSNSNPVERSVRVGSPLTNALPERPVVCRFRFRPHLNGPGAACFPLLAAPLLSAAASALEELKQRRRCSEGWAVECIPRLERTLDGRARPRAWRAVSRTFKLPLGCTNQQR